MDSGFSRRNIIGGAGALGLGAAGILAVAKSTPTSATAKPPLVIIPDVAVPAAGGVDLSAFWPKGFRRRTDDASPVFNAAAIWSAKYLRPVFVQGRYRLTQPVRILSDGTHFQFRSAYILVADLNNRVRIKFGQMLPLAFLVSASNVKMLGKVTLEGTGQPGETLLQGLFCEEAANIEIGEFTIRNMAIGLHFMCCDNVRCGDTVAYSMWGRQPADKERAGAGSAQVVSGCRNSVFGRLQSWSNDKPARYLSVGKTETGERRDNANNYYGFVEMTAREGSPWAQVTGIRSSVNSRFEGGSGKGAAFLLLCQKYKTDNAYSIDGNDFGNWSGDIADRHGSVEAAGYFWVEDGGTPIGSNAVGTLRASCPLPDATLLNRVGYKFPQTFGIYINSGNLTLDEVDLTGFSFQINAFDCKIDIGSFHSRSPFFQPFRYGYGTSGSIRKMTLHSDISGPAANVGIMRAEKLGKPGQPVRFEIGELDCSGATSKIRSEYVVYDAVFEEGAMNVRSLRGQCGSGQGFFKGRKRQIKRI
jgi:hypothetical protein